MRQLEKQRSCAVIERLQRLDQLHTQSTSNYTTDVIKQSYNIIKPHYIRGAGRNAARLAEAAWVKSFPKTFTVYWEQGFGLDEYLVGTANGAAMDMYLGQRLLSDRTQELAPMMPGRI